MSDQGDALATVEEIRSVTARVKVVLERYGEIASQGWGLGAAAERRLWRLIEAATAGIYYCTASAEILGDPSVIPALDELHQAATFWEAMDSHELQPAERLLSAIRELLAREDVPQAVLLSMAEHVDGSVRRQVAQQLDPADAVEREGLRKLAADPIAEVRKAAQETLAEVEPAVWWWGKFDHDPLRGLSPLEVTACQPLLVKLVALLDTGRDLYTTHMPAFLDVVRKLPDGLAIELVERQVRDLATLRGNAHIADLFYELLRRPAGATALRRLLDVWDLLRFEDQPTGVQGAGKALARLPSARHHAVGQMLFDTALVAHEGYASTAVMAGEILAIGWRDTEDASAMVEQYFAQQTDPPDGWSTGALKFQDKLKGWRVSAATRRELMRAWVRENPPLLASLEHQITPLIDPLPDHVVRPVVNKVLADDARPSRLRWALWRAFTSQHEEGRDGPRAAKAARYFADPRLRSVIVADEALIVRTFVPARRALRAGELDATGAGHTLHVIHDFYGGLQGGPAKEALSFEANARRISPRGRWGRIPIQVPPPLRGPITGQEWDLYREARARQPPTRYDAWQLVLSTLPAGPLQAVDRPFFDAALAQVRGGDGALLMLLAHSLARRATLEDLPTFEEMVALAVKLEGSGPLERIVERARAQAYALHEVAVPTPERKRRRAGESTDETRAWMDEPDDG